MENLLKKKNNLPGILTMILVVVVVYLAIQLANTERNTTGKGLIIDPMTGLALSKDEVDAIAQKQEQDRVTHTLVGKVTAKLRGSLQAEITTNGKTRLLQIKFAPQTVFLKSMPLPGFDTNPSAVGEKQISLADVNIGDTVTITFPAGVFLRDIGKLQVVTIDNLLVDMPHGSHFSED